MSLLLIVSGPSGVGKSTVIGRLIASGSRPLRLAVSATTRKPRGGETDGVHYHFWDVGRFLKGVENGEFLEHAEVHGDHYGTPTCEVDPHVAAGVGVILDIDVQGAAVVRAARPEAVSVFLTAPDPADYERRIRARGDVDEAAIRRRLARVAKELARAGEYDLTLVNDDVDRTVKRLEELIEDWHRNHEGVN